MTVRIAWHVRTIATFMRDGRDLPVALTWWSDEPLEVTLELPAGSGAPRWSVDRSLLADGVRLGLAGLGDVGIFPVFAGGGSWAVDPALRQLVLSAPSGRAAFYFVAAEVEDFLRQTRFRVPEGAEQVPVDEIEQYLRFLTETGETGETGETEDAGEEHHRPAG